MRSKLAEEDPILTTSGASKHLGVATSTVQMWMESGLIRSWKTPGGHRRTYLSYLPPRGGKPGAGAGKRNRRGPLAVGDAEFLPVAAPDCKLPAHEAERLAGLAALNLVGTPPEERFQRIVRLACAVTGSPIALISLVTSRQLWIKASVGLPAGRARREWSFCTHAIAQDGPLVVEDAESDARFSGLPLVLAEPHVRFYAGIPLASAGLAMGTLCVMDPEARKLRASELQALADLAQVASGEIAKGWPQ